MDVFPEETAMDFLLTGRPYETREAASRLASALGHLPLALSHARAYCAETNLSFNDYVRRLSELIQKAPQNTEYPASVFATFTLAIAKAEAQCSVAGTILLMAAFYAPERIPIELLTLNQIQAQHGWRRLFSFLPQLWIEATRDKGIAALAKVSLVTLETLQDGFPTVTVHRLVQEVTRGQAWTWTQDVFAKASANLLLNALSTGKDIDRTDWPRMQRLVPHALSVLNRFADSRGNAELIALLCNRLANYFRSRAEFASAEPLLIRALANREAALGPDHPKVAKQQGYLGGLYFNQGRYAEAEPLLTGALAIAEAALGPDHPEVAKWLNDLAVLYDAQGRYDDAESLLKRALAIVEAAHVPDHPHVSKQQHTLGAHYRKNGRHAEAEPLLTGALAMAEATLRPDHLHIAHSLNSLAVLYNAQGRYDEAEPLLKRAIPMAEAALGSEHPDVALMLINVALLYKSQGRYDDAELLFKRALATAEAALGPEHPDTHRVRHNYEHFRKAVTAARIGTRRSSRIRRKPR